ncbi:MAG: GMP/IMP nucleotidase [Gammaproteobacteria bacterium]|nr:GMP/IMP nucleotidase [Gammaproteobacteria bacterium]
MLDWSQVDTVLLDMDGTLLDLSFDNYFWSTYVISAFARQNNLSLSTARAQLVPKFESIKGTLNWYCLDYWSERLDLDIAALKAEIQHQVAFRPSAVRFLQFLSEQPVEVYLATNAHPKTLEIKLLNANFHQYFNALVTSHELGAPKEQQEFWRALQQSLNFDPARTLFIDDSQVILEAAETFGIAHLFGIAQPDSQQPARNMLPYHALTSFDEIIPR